MQGQREMSLCLWCSFGHHSGRKAENGIQNTYLGRQTSQTDLKSTLEIYLLKFANINVVLYGLGTHDLLTDVKVTVPK